jgi:hypothetical protein
MTPDWRAFPSRPLKAGTPLFRIHRARRGPTYFGGDGTWRFDPPPSHRGRYGVCYLAVEDLASYVEVFGRIRVVPQTEIDRRRLSEMPPVRGLTVADLTNRKVLGDFGVTAAHSTSSDYTESQELSAHFFDAGFDGILYRIRHDPAMQLEAVAIFGESGDHPHRFSPPKTGAISDDLIERGEAFGIEVVPSTPLL